LIGPEKIHIYNRDGILFHDPETRKGVFGYRDQGFNKDGKPYDKIWIADVFYSEPKKITGKKHEPWNFQRIHTSQCAFSKIGIHPQQLPMLIKLATLLYGEVAGVDVAAPVLPKPLDKPSEVDELYNMVMGRPKF
jgi:hypothetical protein